MNWRELFKFVKSFLPMRVWVVEYDGVRIGWGPREDAMDDFESLDMDEQDNARLYSYWTTRRKFLSAAESGGR